MSVFLKSIFLLIICINNLSAEISFNVEVDEFTDEKVEYIFDSTGSSIEIEKSLTLLSEKAEISPTHYSYPEGLEHCYSDCVIERLKKYGVQCCPTAIEGRNPSGMDPFELRRVMVA